VSHLICDLVDSSKGCCAVDALLLKYWQNLSMAVIWWIICDWSIRPKVAVHFAAEILEEFISGCVLVDW
jgi:hypothetical protein